MPALQLEHVSKHYRRHEAVFADLNLTIEEKEFTVLFGPALCGESTLLRLIAGIEKPTGGMIYIDDDPVGRKTPETGKVAMVFRNHALYPHMTIRENIAYSLKIRKKQAAGIQEQVDRVAALLGLEDLLERKPVELSAGQQQMVAIARALVRKPKLVLLDEPLAGLDVPMQRKMRQTFREIYEQSESAFLYATHDPAEAMAMGTQIIVMRDGQIQQKDTPEKIYTHPVNTFVAELFGAPGMNLWKAKVKGKKHAAILQIGNLGEYSLSGGSSKCLAEAGYLKQDILVGVRPEQIQLQQTGGLSAVSGFYGIDGSAGYLYLESSDKQVTVRVENDREPGLGTLFHFGMEEADLHLFDPATGNRIEV